MPKESDRKDDSESGTAAQRAEDLGRSLMGLHNRSFRRKMPGTAAGIEHHELVTQGEKGPAAVITCVDYCPERVEFKTVTNLEEFITGHRAEWSRVRWINVD